MASFEYITFEDVGPDYEIGDIIEMPKNGVIKVMESFDETKKDIYVVVYDSTSLLKSMPPIIIKKYKIIAKKN